MRIRLQLALDSLRYSFLLIPGLLGAAGLILGLLLVALDARLPEFHDLSPLFIARGPDAARSLLSTVASSILTVATLAFSIAITALVLASGQFGSRLLRNFLDDPPFSWTLGLFCGTFLLSLVALRATRGADDVGGVFVPQTAVSVALFLTVLCVFALIFFLNHVARSVQAPYVAADAAKDLHREIDRLFAVSQLQKQRASSESPLAPPDGPKQSVQCQRNGYIKAINYQVLIALATRHDAAFEMSVRPGDWVCVGQPLFQVFHSLADEKSRASWLDLARDCVILGRTRSPLQDPEFGINQLVEIAVRALSPAINDPFTAMTCLDHLGAALRHVLRLELPSPHLLDARGQLRVIAKPWTFEGLCDAAFHMIRQNARNSVAVSIRLLETLERVGALCETPSQRAAIARHAEMMRRNCALQTDETHDTTDLDERWERVTRVLETPPSEPQMGAKSS